MKKIGIGHNKGGVGKTTFCFCLGGAFAEMDKKVLMVDMEQRGSLSSPFAKNINDIPCVITDVLPDDRGPMKTVVHKTDFETIDPVPANLTLGRLENDLISERDSHYCLADKFTEIEGQYDVILLDAPSNLGLATRSVLTASEGVIIPLEAQDYSVKRTGYLDTVIQKVRKRGNPSLTVLGYVTNRATTGGDRSSRISSR